MKLKRIIYSALGAFLLLCSAFAQAPALPEFSSDMVTTAKGAEQTKGKMYFSKGKMRMDMDAQGHTMSIISDGPAKTSYMIMPEQHMYMEMRADNPMMRRGTKAPEVKQFTDNPCVNEPDVSCKKMTEETVNGRRCDKWEFISKGDNSANRMVWIDQKTHMPIRVVGADGNTIDFKNFKEGPQDASLFEVPDGFQKMDIGSMMGGHKPDNR